MTKRQQRVTPNATPHYSTLVMFVGMATAFCWLGYEEGDAYVKKRFFIDDPMAFLFGGYPGMAVFFGIFLQGCVDLMRIEKPVACLDRKLGELELVALHRVQSIFSSPVEEEPPQANYIAVLPAEEEECTEVRWDNSNLAILKLILQRLCHYGSAILIGASASVLPTDMMYEGTDIFKEQNERICFYGALIIMALQINTMLASYRSDQRPLEIVLSDPDEETQGACFTCCPKR